MKHQKLLEEKNKPNSPSITQPITNTTTIVSQGKQIISNIASNSIRLTEVKSDPTQQDAEMMDVSNMSVSTCEVAIRKNELNDINLESMDFKMETNNATGILSDETQKLQRPNVPNTQMVQTVNKMPSNIPANVVKQPLPVHANINANVQTMVVNAVQKKTSMTPLAPLTQLTADNQQVKQGINLEMQTITVSQQPIVIPTQPAIEKPNQQPPIQMQLNQRTTANQPQINQTMQSLSQIESMQQSPVDAKPIQKIGPIQGEQQRTQLTANQAIQLNQIQKPIQQIDIKTEHQTQQKQTIQLVRPPNVNQPFIAQSLPPNNVNINVNTIISNANVNVNMDQITAGGAVDDSLSNIGPNAQSTSYNQKTYERMRQDEGKLNVIRSIQSTNIN